jgi:hypothetical protein
MNIDDALAAVKATREWGRANPANPVCPGCGRRDTPENLTKVICIECQDTVLFLETGCRFGKRPCCGEGECNLPLLDEEKNRILLLIEQRKI